MAQNISLLGAVLLLLPAQVLAQSRVWTVSPSGSDSGSGFAYSGSFATIQRAIDAASDGDTVEVLPGHYAGPGNGDLDFRGKAISVRSRNPDDPACVRNTVLDASTAHFVARFLHDEGPGTGLAGFTIIGGTSGPVQRGVPGFFEFSQKARPRTRNLRLDARTAPVAFASREGTAQRKVLPQATATLSPASLPGKRVWNYLDPFHQPAATTDYYGSGDVDLDGRITQTDVELAQEMASGSRSPVDRADVNGDGEVDSADVGLLQAAVGGSPLPAWWNQLETPDARRAWLQRMIAIDLTNRHPYADFFQCVNFAKQLTILFSSSQEDPQRDAYEGGQTRFNLPVYEVGVDSQNFGHEINAILVGDNPLNFSDWVFIEPQTDLSISPGDWDMPFGSEVSIGYIAYQIQQNVVTFSVQQAGVSVLSNAPSLIRVRRTPANLSPENRPNLWNPSVLGTGSGLLLFHKTRSDLSGVTDLHVADLATAGSDSSTPLTGSAQFSRNLDAFRGPDGRYHLLWYGGQDSTPSLFYGVLDPVTRTLSTPTRLVYCPHFPREARVRVTPSGEINVFWLEDQQIVFMPLLSGIYWMKKEPTGVWTAPQQLAPLPFQGDFLSPDIREHARYLFDVAFLSDGTLILAWLNRTDFPETPTFMEMRYLRSWSQPKTIETEARGFGGLSLSTDSTGTVHLAYWVNPTYLEWEDTYPSLESVLYHRTLSSGGWSAADRVDPQAAGQCPHLVAVGASVMLFWERHTLDGVSVVWSVFDGKRWGTPQALPVTPGMDPWYPTGERLDNGRVAFAWSERSGDRIGIGLSYWENLLAAQTASLAAAGGAGSVPVNAPANVTWTARSDASWILITSGAAGTGLGNVTFTLDPNTGAARSGTITINRQVFTITQQGAMLPEGLTPAGSFAQIASGGGWDTTLTLINLAGTTGAARLNFYANDGSMPMLPFTEPQAPAAGATLAQSFDETLLANSTLMLDTTGPATRTGTEGFAEVLTGGGIDGFAIFTNTFSNQQAMVPLETRNAPSYLLAFDNTGAIDTGLAIANLATNAANVQVVIRDDTGAQIGTDKVSLEPRGHSAFMLSDSQHGIPATAGKRGTLEFDTPERGRIGVLGLRANGTAVTSLPLMANVGTGGGTFAHVATGGGWQTTFTVVNDGATSTKITLKFLDDNGAPLALPLGFPQSGASATESTVTQTLAAGATLIITTQTADSAAAITGSAQLLSSGNVSGFAIFRFTSAGQEAVVPLETRAASAFVLAYDNSGSLATGIAIANPTARAASVPVVVRDDAGNPLTNTIISLAPNGHVAFMLADTGLGYPQTAGKRGTVEFDVPTGGRIGVLGIRVDGGVVTSIPALTR